MKVQSFTFNPFSENTYILYDETSECIIIDPGCYDAEEKQEIEDYITKENLKPVRLLNTHCHIDHILGNKFIAEKYNLQLEIHPNEEALLKAAATYGPGYGIFMDPSPVAKLSLEEGKEIKFGNSILKMILAPGHSPGSICLYNENDKILIGGDVLFRESIGRSDLPGGDSNTLLESIKNKLYVLPDDVIVFPGHGPATGIGYEKKFNPFVKG